MNTDAWRAVLVAALIANALLGVGYHTWRLTRGGPMADVIGRAVLGVVLLALAIAVALEVGWAHWAALIYGLLFGLAAMPVWVLGVLLPLEPGKLDYAFTAAYWLCALAVIPAAIAL
jgi:hypothetical protein